MPTSASQKDLPTFLTVKELAGMLRVKVRTVYAWVADDLIPYHKPGRITIFRLDEIIEWLEKKKSGWQIVRLPGYGISARAPVKYSVSRQ